MIVVIGGGITGLAAGYELARRQHEFVLLEASPRVGGLILTEQVGGFTIDGGPDSILVQKPAAIRLCEEVELGAHLMATRMPRTSFVLKRGRLHPLPSPSVLGIPTALSAAFRYDLLPWPARARLALEPLVPRGTSPDESVASFFRRRFGAETVGLIAEPLLGGIHAGDVEELSIASLFPGLAAAERKPGRVLRNLRTEPALGAGGLFRALRGGMYDLVTAIVSRLPERSIHVHAPVVALEPGPSWRVRGPAGMHDADAVIVAAPAHAAAAWLEPITPDAARICRDVPYVSTVSVALGYRRRDVHHPLEGTGFVVARRHNTVRITACTWVSSKWECRAPEDHALVRVFIGGAHDPGAVDLADEALVDIAVRDVSAVLAIRGSPVLWRIYRWNRAGAQHVVGHASRMRALATHLERLPGLYVAGSGFDSIGIPDCIANGRRAAAAAADYASMR